MKPAVLVLDAMGVLYTAADDVAELLVPYLHGLGCPLAPDEIERLYTRCSLGGMSSTEFWAAAGVEGKADDAGYCAAHRLTPGIPRLLSVAAETGTPVACLTNDVARWSTLLRQRFGLDTLIDPWVVSGEVGARKPDPAIYRNLLDRLGVPAAEVILVDDRARNVDTALRLGMRAVHFAPPPGPSPEGALRVASVGELTELVRQWR